MHEVYLEQGTGQGTPRARDQAREAAEARQDEESDDERGDDQDASARQGDEGGDERDDDQDATNPLARTVSVTMIRTPSTRGGTSLVKKAQDAEEAEGVMYKRGGPDDRTV